MTSRDDVLALWRSLCGLTPVNPVDKDALKAFKVASDAYAKAWSRLSSKDQGWISEKVLSGWGPSGWANYTRVEPGSGVIHADYFEDHGPARASTIKRLYVLEPNLDSDRGDDVYGFFAPISMYAVAVLATDEDQARQMAEEAAETNDEDRGHGLWLDREATVCREVPLDEAVLALRAWGTG